MTMITRGLNTNRRWFMKVGSFRTIPTLAPIGLLGISLVTSLVAAPAAQTNAWTLPVALSTGGQGATAAAAIDGNGNSVALWDERTSQDQIWSRLRPSAGNWGSVTNGSPRQDSLLRYG